MLYTFEKIMEIGQNKIIFKKLLDEYKTDVQNPNNRTIVPFVGAGLSVCAGYPLWGNALEQINLNINGDKSKGKEISKCLENGEYQTAAEELYKCNNILFYQLLRDIFSQTHMNIEALNTDSVILLPYLFPHSLVMTTNYDRVIEQAYLNVNNKIIDRHIPNDNNILTEIEFNNNRCVLFKIHGDVNSEQNDIIITKENYNQIYNVDGQLVQRLKNFFSTRRILFLGASLRFDASEPDRLLNVFESLIKQNSDAYYHYAILPFPNDTDYDPTINYEETLSTKINELSNSHHILPIFYPKGNFECIKILLEELLRGGNETEYKLYVQKQKALHKKANINRKNPFLYSSQATEFIGRDYELEKLKTFLNTQSDYSVMWWAITGFGGSGKSRLAYELCKQLPPEWRSFTLTRNHPCDFNYINKIFCQNEKNLLLIIDTSVSDLSIIAKWIAATNFNLNNSKQVRIVFLRREIDSFNNAPQWVTSILDADENNRYSLYDSNFICLSKVDKTAILGIIKSYIKNIYPNCNISSDDIDLLLLALDKIDFLNRPLFAMFIADAYANGKDTFVWSEEDILEYIYQREQNIIRDKIEQAFYVKYQDNRELYDNIELMYASATIHGGCDCEKIRLDYHDAYRSSGMEETQFIDRLNNYGLAYDSFVPAIEPDIIGEFFVLKKTKELKTIYCNIPFYTRFCRDLYRLLNTKYIDEFKEILSWDTAGILELAYVRGLFELTYDENVRLSTAEEAISYLIRVIPIDRPLGLRVCEGVLLAQGLANLAIRQEFDGQNTSIGILQSLYNHNKKNSRIAEAFVKGLMILNEGRWYSKILNEIKDIYSLHFDSDEVKALVLSYANYLLSINTPYKKDSILNLINIEQL